MSPRTILVGIFAALCGICATVGVNYIRSKPPASTSTIVTAKHEIKPGVQIKADMLTQVEWTGGKIPEGAFRSIAQLTGKYTTQSFVPNEPLIDTKISDNPTFLQIPDGMRAATIVTQTESSMVAGLVAPGNRVDLVWTVTEKNNFLEGPVTMTLLENVEVLAVGSQTEISTTRELDPNKKLRSITILVEPDMAEEINLAEELGVLNFTLRSTSETADNEPRQKVSLKELLANAMRAADEPSPKAEQLESIENDVLSLKSLIQSEVERFSELINQSEQPGEGTVATRVEVPYGMRAVSIVTPDDSTGVAGLIQPGNSVDILLTTNLLNTLSLNQLNVRTVTLIENVTVAAVGTQLETNDSPEPQLARSITLFVTPKMAEEINLGSEVGTLRLALRGPDDNTTTGPKTVKTIRELLSDARAEAMQPLEDAVTQEVTVAAPQTIQTLIRVNRGGVNRDIPVYHRRAGTVQPTSMSRTPAR